MKNLNKTNKSNLDSVIETIKYALFDNFDYGLAEDTFLIYNRKLFIMSRKLSPEDKIISDSELFFFNFKYRHTD